MPGYLGSDFDPLQPENSDSVKYGAEWIRDLKRRMKQFVSRTYNLETGQLLDGVVRHLSLRDMPGLTPGTYNRVKVNSKGLVTEGSTSSAQQTAAPYTAAFLYGGYTIEQQTGATLTGGSVINSIFRGRSDYLGRSATGAIPPFDDLYPVTGQYAEYTFSPPAGVRRVLATIIGGGGGAYGVTSSFFGGGGGELAEVIIPLDGTGTESLTIIVGNSGQNRSSTVPSNFADGCPSRVARSAALYVDAGCGTRATDLASGGVQAGNDAGGLLVIRSAGTAGEPNARGTSGSNYAQWGRGGTPSDPAQPGAVYLQWLL